MNKEQFRNLNMESRQTGTAIQNATEKFRAALSAYHAEAFQQGWTVECHWKCRKIESKKHR